MVTIICEVIGAIAMIIVALISKNTNKKVDKISTLKEEFKKEIESEVGKVSKKIDTNEKDNLRFQILSFAGDLRNGVRKTRQEFETIFVFYDKYEDILKELGQRNGYLDTEFNYIKTQYIELETEET